MKSIARQWMRLKFEVRLVVAAWLVCKARDLTPDHDVLTQLAFCQLLKAMIADDIGRDRLRAWVKEPTKRDAR